ncbi:hypothetical protein BJ170DRAFT_589219 [Xylariales sp. AK1849]|nr:hypothetical protein BJ170DRAFT_589219 [Xylariales sp. AK1849]
MSTEVSHGRGGAGNINPDDAKYVDGEIVRTGEEGTHGDGAFSTGRGGGGNIGDAGKPSSIRADKDVVPEAATRVSEDADAHVGRGGAGNIHLGPEHQKRKVTDGVDHHEASTNHSSVADKLKAKVLGVFGKK